MVFGFVPVLLHISYLRLRPDFSSGHTGWCNVSGDQVQALSKERAPEDVKLPFHHACLEQLMLLCFFQSMLQQSSLLLHFSFRSGIHVLEWQVQSINIIQRLSVKIDAFHVGPNVRVGNYGSCTTSLQQELHGYQPLVFRPWHWQHYNFVTLTLHVVAYPEYFTYGWPLARCV